MNGNSAQKGVIKNPEKKIYYPELSYQIVGILFRVHNKLGSSYLEKFYQRAIATELKRESIKFRREVKVEIGYGDNEVLGHYRLDFLVEEKIILEIKAQQGYNPKFFKQVLSYLKITNLPLAIIANFRRPKLEYKRIINKDCEPA